MNYSKLKKKIEEIANIAKSAPDEFKEKCFELLLDDYLERERRIPGSEKAKDKRSDGTPSNEKGRKEEIHIKVKAFLRKFDLTPDQLKKLFWIEGDLIEPIYKLTTTGVSKSQIQISLLEALKEAIKSGKFEFNTENIRSLCNDKKCYDKSNFTKHFKNNKGLFKSETFTKEEPVELSDEGAEKLAGVIKELTPKA